MGTDGPPAFMNRVRNNLQGHIDAVSKQLMEAFAAELEKLESDWEEKVQQLMQESEHLREHFSSGAQNSLENDQRKRPRPVAADDDDEQSPVLSQSSRRVSRRGSKEHSKMPPRSPKSVSAQQGFLALVEIFKKLDGDGTGIIKTSALKEQLVPMVGKDDAHCLEKIPSLIAAMRSLKPELCRGLDDGEISLKLLRHLMLGQDVTGLEAEHVSIVNVLRSSCVHQATLGVVSDAVSGVTKDEVSGTAKSAQKDRLWWLEPMTACVIIVNAVVIGLSLDIEPNSLVWEVIELSCTIFFILELVLKVITAGPLEHCLGADWKWNLFDLLLVVFAIVDVMVSTYIAVTGEALPGSVSLRDFSVLRILRLLRLARIARLFRLTQLKELALMTSGIIGGLRTLFWAFVLLFVFVYVLGIVSHQSMLEWRAKTRCEDDGFHCNEFELVLYEDYGPMFADLFRTSFTVFRCVTGDCSFHSGVPIATILLETHGKAVVVCYVMSLLFVMVCVFNLIMAVFVENTLDYARQNPEKENFFRHQENIQLARKLQKIVDNIVARVRKPSLVSHQHSGLLRYLPKGTAAVGADCEVELPTPFTVTRELFDEAMSDSDTKRLLELLEINTSNLSRLFDILDSNGNGELDIHEIVDGLMRLRGPADKSDIVSNGLMIRHMQKMVTEMKFAIDNFEVPLSFHSEGLHSQVSPRTLVRKQPALFEF